MPGPDASQHIRIAPAVRAALDGGEPVVALESTLISHGLPAPHNLACARAAEAAVREQGALPATIGIIGGRITVGLDDAGLQTLADPGSEPVKASLRDLAAAVACKRHASTTVAATMWACARVGAPLFATGGIGGVHRGASASFDISADIHALATLPVAVVCAGAKLVLDLPKTAELLETAGVPLLGLRCEQFPGFYVRETGIALDTRIESEQQAAAVIRAHAELGMPGGMLILNPVPEAHALPAGYALGWVEQAVAEADEQGITGKAVTPFLLDRMAALSGGDTLAANVALITHNAATAARIAVALATGG